MDNNIVKKFLILENDTPHQGLPDMLTDCLEMISDVPYDVWYFFNVDVQNHPKESLARFAAVESDTLILSYPSFVGYGNSFEGKLRLFKTLKDKGIRLNLAIMKYPDFYWYLVKWVNDENYNPKKKKEEIEILKEVLDFHSIGYFRYDDVVIREIPFFEAIKSITWESLELYYYPRKSKVKEISTGIVREVEYVFIREDNVEYSEVECRHEDPTIFNGVRLKLIDVEKVK